MIKATPRKFLAFGLSAAVALGVLVGAPSANAISGSNCNLKSKPSNASCDVFTYGALHRVQSLDPINPIGGYTEGQMAYIVQGKLYRYGADGKPRRDLVESATVSADGKTITHVLKDGIKYSDGTKIVAADAVNSYKRWVESKRSASYISSAHTQTSILRLVKSSWDFTQQTELIPQRKQRNTLKAL
jgi:ABC-type transport system substrate-binding protein